MELIGMPYPLKVKVLYFGNNLGLMMELDLKYIEVIDKILCRFFCSKRLTPVRAFGTSDRTKSATAKVALIEHNLIFPR